MKKMMNWVMAAILICGAGVFTSCSSDDDENVSIDVNYNPSTETRSFNRVLDRVKSDMAEINFQDLDILIKSLREGTATISCTDHNDAGIKKAVVDLRVLLENFFAVDSKTDTDGGSWRLGDLSTTLRLAMEACISFEKTADKQYTGEGLYEESLFVEINDMLSYEIIYSVDKRMDVVVSELGTDELRTMTIKKNGATVLAIVNEEVFDHGLKDQQFFIAKQKKGYVEYGHKKFVLDRTGYNADYVVSHLKYINQGTEVLGITLQAESDLNWENLLHHDVVFTGELGISMIDGAFEIVSDIKNMNAFMIEGLKLAGIAVTGTTKEKCQKSCDDFNAVVTSKLLSTGKDAGTIDVEAVAVDSERDIYRPGIIVQSKLINNGEKATFKEFLEALGGTFESLLKGLIE